MEFKCSFGNLRKLQTIFNIFLFVLLSFL
ncbi:hypothetical protein Godav_006227 [Gossypium davidsonii]|uniref:Uncharacterized protein n=1 Tax=Gossypium davidsonii TaxID=34287 RepID=A0A7J8S349_GOSDV|nr:hypothetical protein [Gossypium davidsonii]